MSDTIRKEIMQAFPAVKRAVFRVRKDNKHYLTVFFYEDQGAYKQLLEIKEFLKRLGYTSIYMTSGGGNSGTFRLNPE